MTAQLSAAGGYMVGFDVFLTHLSVFLVSALPICIIVLDLKFQNDPGIWLDMSNQLILFKRKDRNTVFLGHANKCLSVGLEHTILSSLPPQPTPPPPTTNRKTVFLGYAKQGLSLATKPTTLPPPPPPPPPPPTKKEKS